MSRRYKFGQEYDQKSLNLIETGSNLIETGSNLIKTVSNLFENVKNPVVFWPFLIKMDFFQLNNWHLDGLFQSFNWKKIKIDWF